MIDGTINGPDFKMLKCQHCAWEYEMTKVKKNEGEKPGDHDYDYDEIVMLLDHCKEEHMDLLPQDEVKSSLTKVYSYDVKHVSLHLMESTPQICILVHGFDVVEQKTKQYGTGRPLVTVPYLNVGKNKLEEVIHKVVMEKNIPIGDIVLSKNEKGNYQVFWYKQEDENLSLDDEETQ